MEPTISRPVAIRSKPQRLTKKLIKERKAALVKKIKAVYDQYQNNIKDLQSLRQVARQICPNLVFKGNNLIEVQRFLVLHYIDEAMPDSELW